MNETPSQFNAAVPKEALRWSWAGFLVGTYWAVRHRIWLPLWGVGYFVFALLCYWYALTNYAMDQGGFPFDGTLGWDGAAALMHAAAYMVFPTPIVVFLAVHIYLGLRGGRLAWHSRTWSSVEEFVRDQHRWSVLGDFTMPFFLFLMGLLYLYLGVTFMMV